MANLGRPKYDPVAKAKAIVAHLTKEQLEDKDEVWAAIRSKGLKLSPQAMGKIRTGTLKAKFGVANNSKPETNGRVQPSMKNVDAVLKLLPSVGGIEGLEATVALIKKIKEKV